MCKSKNVIPADDLLKYVVILEEDATPKVIKEDISFNLASFNKGDKLLNQWTLEYDEGVGKEQKIKAALLNHPKVVSVFTKEQLETMLLKRGKKSGIGSLGKDKDSKQ